MNEVEANEIPKCKLHAVSRTSSDVICDLAYERMEISAKLGRLSRAIEANPEAVSSRHKDLWRKQAKAMRDYVDVLAERIKDLIDNG